MLLKNLSQLSFNNRPTKNQSISRVNLLHSGTYFCRATGSIYLGLINGINIVLNKGTDINITWQEFIAASKFDKPGKSNKLSEYIMNQQNRMFARLFQT